jgi:hypothetical protein
MYICLNICMHACLHVFSCSCLCLCVCVCVYANTCAICALNQLWGVNKECMYVCMRICVYVDLKLLSNGIHVPSQHAYMHKTTSTVLAIHHIHTKIYTYIHTYIHIGQPRELCSSV